MTKDKEVDILGFGVEVSSALRKHVDILLDNLAEHYGIEEQSSGLLILEILWFLRHEGEEATCNMLVALRNVMQLKASALGGGSDTLEYMLTRSESAIASLLEMAQARFEDA